MTALIEIEMHFWMWHSGESTGGGNNTVARWPIFRLNNSKEAQKIVHGRTKLEAVKWQNWAKSGRKEAGKYFHDYLHEKPYNFW
jgi:hypothetical protein